MNISRFSYINIQGYQKWNIYINVYIFTLSLSDDRFHKNVKPRYFLKNYDNYWWFKRNHCCIRGSFAAISWVQFSIMSSTVYFLTRFQFPFVVVKSKRWIAREGGGLHALHIGSTLQEIFTITTGSSKYNSFWFSARYCLGTKHFTFLKGPTKGFRTILSSLSSSSPFISHLKYNF